MWFKLEQGYILTNCCPALCPWLENVCLRGQTLIPIKVFLSLIVIIQIYPLTITEASNHLTELKLSASELEEWRDSLGRGEVSVSQAVSGDSIWIRKPDYTSKIVMLARIVAPALDNICSGGEESAAANSVSDLLELILDSYRFRGVVIVSDLSVREDGEVIVEVEAVIDEKTVNISDLMLKTGHVRPWTGKRESWCSDG